MKKRIIFADDNTELVKLVKHYLEQKKFEVFTAGDGWEAISLVKKVSPHLLLLDIEMPQMDGIKTIETMASFDLALDMPIILVSAHREKELILKAAHLGVVDYIVKPFELGDLLPRLHKHLIPIDEPLLKELCENLKPVRDPKRVSQIPELVTGDWVPYSCQLKDHEWCVLLPKWDHAPSYRDAIIYLRRGTAWRRVVPDTHKEAVAA